MADKLTCPFCGSEMTNAIVNSLGDEGAGSTALPVEAADSSQEQHGHEYELPQFGAPQSFFRD